MGIIKKAENIFIHSNRNDLIIVGKLDEKAEKVMIESIEKDVTINCAKKIHAKGKY